MKGHGSKFEQKKEEAIVALLTQRNIEEAAKSIGVAPNTLLRWMKEPEFDAAYREARRAAFRQSVARLQQASGAAVSTLLKLMFDPATPPSTRARAADSVLDHSARRSNLRKSKRASRNWSGLRKPQGRADEMSRSFDQRLKRLEIHCGPTSLPREIVIEIVGQGKEVLRTFVLKGGRLECPKDSPA
jgi:transposase-like protein